MRVVLDNSVTVGWFHPHQATPYGLAMLALLGKIQFHLPAHWPLELGNSLLQLERRRLMTRPRRQNALNEALAMDWVIDTNPSELLDTSAIAQEYGLTTYDAAYLGHARRLDCPLATQDKALKAAAMTDRRWFNPDNFSHS